MNIEYFNPLRESSMNRAWKTFPIESQSAFAIATKKQMKMFHVSKFGGIKKSIVEIPKEISLTRFSNANNCIELSGD